MTIYRHYDIVPAVGHPDKFVASLDGTVKSPPLDSKEAVMNWIDLTKRAQASTHQS